ncbi:MAG TPA: DPP IV N-terminal domain-containing protein, partial [Methanosarcina sp.]|nr:DPP IV N-terminal domain-containing protein [Methanosarcina sp.]
MQISLAKLEASKPSCIKLFKRQKNLTSICFFSLALVCLLLLPAMMPLAVAEATNDNTTRFSANATEFSASLTGYENADKFLPENAIASMFNVSITPNWINGTNSFWYTKNDREGKKFMFVDTVNLTKDEAFDHELLAKALSNASKTEVNSSDLPFDKITFLPDIKEIRFSAFNESWQCDLHTYRVSNASPWSEESEGELLSPDGKLAAFVKDHNIWIREMETGKTYPITTDGIKNYAYGEYSDNYNEKLSQERLGIKSKPLAKWSPDSRRIATFKMDERNVTPISLLQYVPENGSRPKVWTYKYPMPGDKYTPMYEPIVLDVVSRKVIPVKHNAFPETLDLEYPYKWNKAGNTLYSVYDERDEKELHLLKIDPSTGQAKEILNESTSTYIEWQQPNFEALDNDDFIWFSERSGYGHLYLYDNNGSLKNSITAGNWTVRNLLSVDENRSLVYFTAGGRETGRDPYYQHLYRVNLNGSNLELLTPEDADHHISMSPDGRSTFVDTYSRVDLPPVTALKSNDGKTLLSLEKGDIDNLVSMGWKFPERFSVKSLDDQYDIYGIIIRPTTFNESLKYPVIEFVYPGPQTTITPKAFPYTAGGWNPIWLNQALSEMGFIVVIMDAPGTPGRSKAFHDVSYGHLGIAGGLANHVNGLQQLAKDRPYMDLGRVGMYGHSGGGFMTAQALLTYPDFYKVGVASSGNYDSRYYAASWGEKYEGMPQVSNYTEQITELKA